MKRTPTPHNFCIKHDQEHESTALLTGEHSYCTRCSDEKVAASVDEIRAELTAKGYKLGEAHADPPRTWASKKAETA